MKIEKFNFWIVILFVIFLIVCSISIPIYIHYFGLENMSTILKEFAIINITIAIGLIAATISVEESTQKDSMIYLGLLQILIGVVSYFLGLLKFEIISTLYLILNGISIGGSIIKFLRHYNKI